MVTETATKKRWRVEFRSHIKVLDSFEADNAMDMERQLAHMVKEEWVLRDGDSIHIIRQTWEQP